MPDQLSDEGPTGSGRMELPDVAALADARREVQAARDQVQSLGDILRDALGADELLASGGRTARDEADR